MEQGNNKSFLSDEVVKEEELSFLSDEVVTENDLKKKASSEATSGVPTLLKPPIKESTSQSEQGGLDFSQTPSEILAKETPKEVKDTQKKTLKSFAFDINEAKRKAVEEPLKPIPLSKEEAFKQVNLLEKRQLAVNSLAKGQEQLAKKTSNELTSLQQVITKGQEDINKLSSEGRKQEAESLWNSLQPTIYQFKEKEKELNSRLTKLNYYDKRAKATDQEMINISEGQQSINNQWDRLNAGLNTLSANFLRSPQFAYNTLITAQNKIAREIGLPEAPYQEEGYLSNMAKYFEQNADAYHKVVEKKQKQADYDIISLFKKGENAKALNLLLENIVESAPTTGAIAMGGVAGLTNLGTTIGGGLVFGAGTFEENKKKGIDDATNVVNSWTNGLLEGIFESTGTLSIINDAKNIFVKSGKEAVEESAKNIWQKVYGKAAEKLFPVTSAVKEGISEGETTFTQNIVNIVQGVDEEYNKKYQEIANSDLDEESKNQALSELTKEAMFKGVPDAFLTGVGMGAILGGGAKKGYVAVDDKNRKEVEEAKKKFNEYATTLTNPTVSAEAKELIQQKAKEEADKIVAIQEQDDNDLKQKLTKEDYESVVEIQSKISNLEKSIDNIDNEQSKAVVYEQVNELNKEKAEILKREIKQENEIRSTDNNIPKQVESPQQEINLTPIEVIAGKEQGDGGVAAVVQGDGQHTAGYADIALDYLFTGGRDVIQSTDYFLQALVGGFTKASKEIDDIRNKYASRLGNIKDDIGSEAYNEMVKEIKDVVSKKYNDVKASELLDKIFNNSTGFVSREGNQVSSELETLNEQSNLPQEKALGENKTNEVDALKDIDSTAAALNELTKDDRNANDNLFSLTPSQYFGSGNNWRFGNESVADAYHADKAAGKETELTKAVEKLLTPKTETPQAGSVGVGGDVEDYKGIFNPKKTGISGLDVLLKDDGYNYFYKGVSGEVVMMSPDEYLKRVREGLKTKEDANIIEDKKDAINEAINEGNKIDMPFISTKDGKFSQEGRNRAVVARERGEKLIPVFIEKDVSFDDKIAKGQEYINSAIKDGATTKEEVLSKLEKQGLHRDAIRFIDNNFDDKAVEQSLKETPKAGSVGVVGDFKIDDKDTFYHASNTKRSGRLKPSTAKQFGTGVYFTTNKDLAKSEFGEEVTEVKLALDNPVYTNTKEWSSVEKLALEKANEGKPKDEDGDIVGEEYDIAEIKAKFISDAAKELGYDAIIDKNSSQYENEILVLDETKIKYPEDISEQSLKETPQEVKVNTPEKVQDEVQDGSTSGYNPKFKTANKVLGEETTIEMPNGETREAEYMVVESDDILASHNEVSFNDTVGFPKTKDGRNANSRNYKGDKSAQLKVDDNAKNLKPSIVISDTATTDGGVPIISQEGIVISGNGRTMAIKLSQKIAPEKYQAYKADLLKRAAKFGLDPNEVAKMKNPILVKVDKNIKNYSVKTFDEFNGKFQKEESPIDKAIKRSSIIQNDEVLKDRILSIIGRHETMSDLFDNKADRKELFDFLIANDIILKQETPKYLQENGEFTPDGKDLINDVLIATILSPETLEATSNVKAFRNKIINALPVLTVNYKLGKNSLETEINDAILLQSKIATMGSQEEFWTHLKQLGMFETANPNTVIINRMINNGAINFKKFIVTYNKSMEIDENNLFAADQVLTKQQVIDNLKQSNLKENEKQIIANLEELYAANEQKRPSGNAKVDGGNKAEQLQTPTEKAIDVYKRLSENNDTSTRKEYKALPESIKRVLDNIVNIHQQLEQKNIITKKGNCP